MLKMPGSVRLLVCLVAIASLPLALAARKPEVSRNTRSTVESETATGDEESGDAIHGFTEPYADISMAASEMGTLAKVLVTEGDVVKAGQLLASLDDAVLKASLKVAAAGMKAEGELLTATTQLKLKKVEAEKIARLFERNHASQQEVDRVNGEVSIAEARIQSVREDLEIRRLEYARIEAQLQQRQVRSTIDGVVVDVAKDHGEFVSPSDPVVARVVQLDPLLVYFSLPNEKRGAVTEGQQVSLKVRAATADARGIVEYVSPTADASSGTFRVKVRLPNGDQRWHGGEKTELVLDGEVPTFVAPKQIAKRPE